MNLSELILFYLRKLEILDKMAAEQMTLRGTLVGHQGWVTKIATTPAIPDMILSASRGRLPRRLECLH